MVGGDRLAATVDKLQDVGIPVSLFIDADRSQIEASAKIGAKFIELHTGKYADAVDETARWQELDALTEACKIASDLGIRVNAGHGLTYWNVHPVACIPGMEELKIGHSIVSRAVLVGMERAVKEMKLAMKGQF